MNAAAAYTEERIDAPPEVVEALSAVPVWWARRARLAGLADVWQDWRLALPQPPITLDEPVDARLTRASAHELGAAYVSAIPRADRVKDGRHYTPKPLADALWTEVQRTRVDLPPGPTVDPASGAGALLIRPLRSFVAARSRSPAQETLAAVGDAFRGVDSDPLAVWLGNAILAAELLPLWARVPVEQRVPLPCLLTQGDGLAESMATASVVVMNPPFGRASLDERGRRRWAASLYGHANWYGIFLHAAVERARVGGLVAAILPASFLGGAYYQRLRRFLSENAPLTRLRLIDDRAGVFAAGVLQETCLAVFRKGGEATAVANSAQTINGRVRSTNLGRNAIRSDAPDLPWLLPRARSDGSLVRAAARYDARLGDYGWTASTGPLVWNRHKSQITSERTAGSHSILWAADLGTTEVRRSPARDHRRWIILRARDEFMRLAEPAVLVQRTTSPEQPRRLVAAVLTRDLLEAEWGGAVVVENHVNVLRCEWRESALTPSLLSALLNTETLDRLYRCMTGTVAVSAYELEALPLPPEDVLRPWCELDEVGLGTAVAAAYA